MIRLLGSAVISAVLFGIVKKYSPEYAILVECGAVILVLWIAYPYICDVLDFFQEYMLADGVPSDYLKIVIKALGVAILTQFAADVCKDCGENALSSKVEFAGKAIVCALSVPMAKALLELALSLIQER